ncbi:DNA-binding WRKY transcription factor, partial [Tanacetum coccineum]
RQSSGTQEYPSLIDTFFVAHTVNREFLQDEDGDGDKCSASKALDDGKVRFEKSSDDGYKWRKYGQKMVKGSKFPRSYYKCRHPKCEVKKILERSYTGQTTEILYKGTHDHPKPQPSCLFTAGALMSIQEENQDKVSYVPAQAVATDMDVTLPQLNLTSNEVADDLDLKRRRTNVDTLDVIPVIKPIREPRLVVQTISEVDIMDDGYRWRKYGQKVVRCNPNNPRKLLQVAQVAECPISEQQLQPLNAETIHSQVHVSNSSFDNVFQSVVNGGVDRYAYIENEVGTRSFDIATLSHTSNLYPPNLGRVLLGP